MLAYIEEGEVIFLSEKFLIVKKKGLGYKIFVSSEFLSSIQIGSVISLWIHTAVKENAIEFYGFLNYKELEFFEMLINVSGIGPKGALTILSIASIETLKKAIATNELSYLTKISGIGRKTAEKIILELKDKLSKEEKDSAFGDELDALEALKSLGYSPNDAREALKKVKNTGNINARIKEALKILGGK
jgi:Holliday junction DNA helicase RuvA